MKICYFTFGCKVNQYETNILKNGFEQNGHITVSDLNAAEVCVINTCTVTAQSDLKMRKLLHRIRRENPGAVIAVCGCYPQAFGKTAPGLEIADIVVGNSNKQILPRLVENYVETGRQTVETGVESLLYPEAEVLSKASNKTRGIIKIQDGCDMFCSYCIIPYARGRSRSKPLSDIEAEAKSLAAAGHSELVVVGINLCDYGKGEEYDLADAVKAVSKSGVKRIRLGSLEPEKFSEDIILKLSKIDVLCPHFHLALQSGCNRTLKEMRRKYDKEEYFTLVNRLRAAFPGCSITTDIMTGFPGESEEDFKESLDFVKHISFTDAHIFPYSQRSGTPASKRSDQIPNRIKEQRAKIMACEVAKSRRKYLENLIGSTQEVLFEREKSPDFHQGHLRNYCVVRVKRFTDTLFREMRYVKITSTDGEYLYGEIVQR